MLLLECCENDFVNVAESVRWFVSGMLRDIVYAMQLCDVGMSCSCRNGMKASSPESACASSGVLLFGVSCPLVRSTANIHTIRIRSTYASDTFTR